MWLFKGLPANILMDTSHCQSWDPVARTLVCDFSRAGVYGSGVNVDTQTSPAPPVRSAVVMRIMAVLRYSVSFQFNEQLTEAHVKTILFGSRQPGELQELLFTEKLEKHAVARRGAWPWPEGSLAGSWVRNNYAHGLDNAPGTGYVLLPVLTTRGGLNAKNLKRAKAKLGEGNRALRHVSPRMGRPRTPSNQAAPQKRSTTSRARRRG